MAAGSEAAAARSGAAASRRDYLEDNRMSLNEYQPGAAFPGIVDGTLVGQADFPVTTPIAFNPGGLACGADRGSAVTPDYSAPFAFTGILHAFTIDLSGDLITDSESEMRLAMARR